MKIDSLSLERELSLRVQAFSTISSTLEYVLQKHCEGSDVPDLVIAMHQTHGRGREGKSFYSPPDTGLYMTFSFSKERLLHSHLTARCAVALHKSISEVFCVNTGLKWVNDLYFNDRKVAGILLRSTDKKLFVSAGINVEMPQFIPEELKGRFGTLTKTCEEEKYQALVISFYRSLLRVLEYSTQTLLEEYRRLCIHINRQVRIQYDGEILVGECIGINDDFSLCLRVDDSIRTFSSGVLEVYL